MTKVTHKFLSIYLFFIFNSLHVPNTWCSSSGETNCVNTTSGNCHSVLVAVSCTRWEWIHSQPAHDTATNTEWQLPEVVLTQFVSPDDEHHVPGTCRELKIKNKYIYRNLCVTLVIYQESLTIYEFKRRHNSLTAVFISTAFKTSQNWNCMGMHSSSIILFLKLYIYIYNILRVMKLYEHAQ